MVDLALLGALAGDWTTEATHRMLPDEVVAGATTFEWLAGERFLIQRSRVEHPQFPDSVSVLGDFDGRLEQHYYDSRGVHRIYAVELGEDTWRMARDAPGFSQRFTGTVSEDGDAIAGLWTLSRDGDTFEDDVAIAFRRVQR